MRILYFTKYTRKGASSRMRSYQYFPFLESEGYKVEVSPLFPDLYLEQLYTTKRVSKLLIVKSYFSRFIKLFSLGTYHCIVIEKELFPYLPSWAEMALALFGVKYMVDYDDAIFHNYDLSDNPVIRFFLKHKIDSVMRHAEVVIAGNDYLAERAEAAGARKVVKIPTVVDLERYQVKEHQAKPVVIGWIGSPTTAKYVKSLRGVLSGLAMKYPLELHIIGAKEEIAWGPWVKNIQWTEQSEVESIRKMDIGIMPLEKSPWESGKCAYKLIQYMACGLPVIASPIGMNMEVVQRNVNGFWADNEAQWLYGLEAYIKNAQLRKDHGFEGRSMVEKKYCLQITQKNISEIIRG